MLKYSCVKLNDDIVEIYTKLPFVDIPYSIDEPIFYERDIQLDFSKVNHKMSNKSIKYIPLSNIKHLSTLPINYDWEIKSWTAHGFWLWKKYDVTCVCKICGVKLCLERLNFKEWGELMTSQYDEKELTKTINKLINKDKQHARIYL